MNGGTIAHGRAAHATLASLHGRNVPDVSLHRPPDHAQEPEPAGREAIETAIALVLASVVAAMLHLGTDGRHRASIGMTSSEASPLLQGSATAIR